MRKARFFLCTFFIATAFFTQALAQTTANDGYTVPESFFLSVGQTQPVSTTTTTTTITTPAPQPQEQTPAPAPVQIVDAPSLSSVTNDKGFVWGILGAAGGYEMLSLENAVYGITGDLGYRFSSKYSLLFTFDALFTQDNSLSLLVSSIMPVFKYNFYKYWYGYAGVGYFTILGLDSSLNSAAAVGIDMEVGAGYDLFFGSSQTWFFSPRIGLNYARLLDTNVSSALTLESNFLTPMVRATFGYQF